MHVIRTRNVHQALPEGVYQLASIGITEGTRNGGVLVMPTPVTTVYSTPCERVMFWPQRDANPFFHLMEGLWMLAGRDDVAFLAQFVDRMRQFSDDGVTLHGAYGYRWFHSFGVNQLLQIEALLRGKPNSRRAVLTMWRPDIDLEATENGKDVPCNTQAYFWNRAGYLNMTITCRSNDMVWGAYGANAVHFSMLQEYMAAKLGLAVGSMWQISNNFHAYADVFETVRELQYAAPTPWKTPDDRHNVPCPYMQDEVKPYPLVQSATTWDRDLALFMEDPTSNGFDNAFFHRVAKPVYWAHKAYRDKKDPDRFEKAVEILLQCDATDWRKACVEWLGRRQANAAKVAEVRNA